MVGPEGKATRARLDDLALETICPECHRPGWCVTGKGKRAEKMHPRRRRVVVKAYAMGWVDRSERLDVALWAKSGE